MKSLSSNIYKFNQVVIQDKETLMIDNNEVVAKKLEILEEKLFQAALEQELQNGEDGFRDGLHADHLEAIVSDGEDLQEADNAKAVENASRQVQELLEEAQREAEAIKAEAIEDAESIKTQIFDEAKQEGYSAGYSEGMAQIEELRSALEAEERHLAKEYEALEESLEPRFIETLTEIYEHVFLVDLKNEKSIIAHLLSTAMHKIEGNSNYLIHVSKEDYPYVSMKKQEILAGTAAMGATLEMIEDMTLGPNDCIIETDGGVFDCGLGTQLEELAQKLRLLSYTKA